MLRDVAEPGVSLWLGRNNDEIVTNSNDPRGTPESTLTNDDESTNTGCCSAS